MFINLKYFNLSIIKINNYYSELGFTQMNEALKTEYEK